MERVKIYNEENFNYEMLTIPLKNSQINFSSCKLKQVRNYCKIEPSPELDVIVLDCPAMVGHSNFSRKPGISVIK